MTYKSGDILLDKYQIESSLGQGAFGDVYLVTHMGLKVKRALKVLRRDAPGVGSTEFNDGQMRFQLEAQLGARLNTPTPHPNLLQVHNFEASENLLVLEMEYAPGGSLAERLATLREENKQMSIEEALTIALEIANGLAVLHECDIVHRDLKPSNILFDDKDHAKVADLGLAQILGGPSLRSQLSNPVPHPGTPGYMSPEQENERGLLKPPADIYALGLILFEMLAGKKYQLVRTGTKVGAFRYDVPIWLDNLILRMLTPQVDIRPWDGQETLRLLKRNASPKLTQVFGLAGFVIVLLGILFFIGTEIISSWSLTSDIAPAFSPTLERVDELAATDILPTPLISTLSSTSTPTQTVPSTRQHPTGTPITATTPLITPDPVSYFATATAISGMPRPKTYTLQEGEFTYCIARRFNVNPVDLLTLNGLTNASKLTLLILQIPQTGDFGVERSIQPHPALYTVMTGDTIYSIACKFGDVYPMAIVAANNLVAPYNLTVSQKLQIP